MSYIPSVRILKLCTSGFEIHVKILQNEYHWKILKYSINYQNPFNLIYYKTKYTGRHTFNTIINLYDKLYNKSLIDCTRAYGSNANILMKYRYYLY